MDILILPIAIALGIGVYLLTSRKHATVYPGSTGLLYRGGKFLRELGPGRHNWLQYSTATTVFIVPTVPFVSHGQQLTVMSSDRFSFRFTITPVLQVTDPRAHNEARLSLGEPSAPHMYGQMLAMPKLQPVLSAVALEKIGAVTLEAFLDAPSASLDGLKAEVEAMLDGVAVIDLLITDITMPPEVRKMFTDVERAKREGMASLERARAEQASLRALANAARSLESNPQLAQLRLLQVMESAKGSKTFVLGQPNEASVGSAKAKDD